MNHIPNGVPEELDGYRRVRSAAEDQQQPTVIFSVIELIQPAQIIRIDEETMIA